MKPGNSFASALIAQILKRFYSLQKIQQNHDQRRKNKRKMRDSPFWVWH